MLVPIALRLPFWLLGLSTDPLWFSSGLTHGLQLLPGFPYLDPNAGFTSEVLGRLAAQSWIHGVVPWWNRYTGVGVPLAGELQPSAFFLPFNLLLLLPEGLALLQITMQIIAGLTTYLLLRELRVSRLSAWVGATLFSFNGTIAWTPGPAAVYYALPFLPLLLWGIERSRRKEYGSQTFLVIGLATAWTILAGFPEPAYISALLVLAWWIHRIVTTPDHWMVARRCLCGWIVGIFIASPLLISFVDYIAQSDSLKLHKIGGGALPWAAVPATIMPYVYGPLGSSFHSKLIQGIWDGIGGYTTTLILLFAAAGVVGKAGERGLKAILAAWVFFALAKTYGVQPIAALINHLPLFREAAFYRYAPSSWELALAILAAFGMESLRKGALKIRWPFGVAIVLLLAGIVLAWPTHSYFGQPRNQLPIMGFFLGIAAGWSLITLAVVAIAWTRLHGERRLAALAGILVVDSALMFLVPLTCGMRHREIDTGAVKFLQANIGLNRMYTLGPIAPNYNAYFGIASIDHNVLPVPRLWSNYIEEELSPGYGEKSSGVVFWPGFLDQGIGESDFEKNLANYRYVGVRYLVTNPGQTPVSKVFSPPADMYVHPTHHGVASRISAVVSWAQSVEGNPSQTVFRRVLVRVLLNICRRLGAVRGPGEKNVAYGDQLVLESGQRANVLLPRPTGSPIYAVGVVISNKGNTSDGELGVRSCSGTSCATGKRSLSESQDYLPFEIALDTPLPSSSDRSIKIDFTHLSGSHPVALWLRSDVTAMQDLRGPNGPIGGESLQLTFQDREPIQGLKKVYSDSLMDLWEVPDPAAYFEVVKGGPCKLSSLQRERLIADCSTPAVLLRRELFMPGWAASVSGYRVAVRQHGIFQAADLPEGRSDVHFSYVPPFMNLGWALSLAGICGLVWSPILLAIRRHSEGSSFAP
ncbi:MAG: hypothetical protein JOZ33_03570 [Acidobacteriaceae bacterium]|nr:hypothetical protein [Acidobacteriaceae bacterium]